MSNQDLGAQAAIQAQINELLVARNKLSTDQESSLSKQLKLVIAIKEAMSGSADGIERARKALENTAAAQDNVTKSTEKSSEAQRNFTADIKKAADESEELNKRLEAAAKIGGMFGDALSGAATSTMGLVKAGGNLVGTLFNVGKTILSLPLKLWDAFLDTAQSGGGGTELAQAYEDVRKQFGDLASGAGKQVVDMYKQLRNSGAEAQQMGLGLGRVFGYGPAGQAAMLKFTAEMAGALGSQMNEVMQQIGKDMVKVTYAIKGMGISNEEAGNAMKFFYNSGQNAGKMMKEMGATAAMMAKQTGFNIKTLSKAMVETTQAFPQFAKQGVQAMAKVADYTHRLGISVKDLQGVFDKFDSFDQAAESASQLSQAFGVNIDAMKMVKEQDPTKRLEMLRESFKAAGKDINNMTSAERKLAEATTGLTGASFEAALGEGNKKKKLSESEKAAQAATKAAKDQTAAMKQLAKSIERIVPQGSGQFKGFFDALVQGFQSGFKHSKTMRGVFRDLRRALRQTFLMGRDLGRLFANNFPGMKEMAMGFRKIFDPHHFHKFRMGVVKSFRDLFKDLEGGDPKASFNKFFDRVKSLFGRIFGQGAGSGFQMMKEGFTKFTTVLGAFMGEAVKKLIGLVTEGLKNFADLIRNPNKIADTAGTAMGFAANFFTPIVEALKKMGPALWDAFKAVLEVAFEKMKPMLEKVGLALAAFFATKFALSFGLALGVELVKSKIKDALQSGTQRQLQSALAANTAALNNAARAGGGALGPAAGPQGPGGLAGAVTNIASVPLPLLGQAALVIGALALIVGGVLIILAGALKAVFAILEPQEFLIGAAAIAAIFIGLGVMGYALAALTPVMNALIPVFPLVIQGLGVMLLLIPLTALALLAAAALISTMPDVSMDQILKFAAIAAIIIPSVIAVALLGVLAGVALIATSGVALAGIAIMLALIPGITALLLYSAKMLKDSAELAALDSTTIAKFGMIAGIVIGSIVVIGLAAAGLGFALAATLGLAIVGLDIALIIALLMPELIKAAIPAVQATGVLTVDQITNFSLVTATLLGAVAITGAMAAALGFGAANVMMGLGVMAVTVFGLGIFILAAVETIGKVDVASLDKVSTALKSVSVLMLGLAPVLLAAALIGSIMMTGIGAVAMIASIVLIANFMTEMTEKLLPKVIEIMKIDIPNPEKAKAVGEALGAVLKALGGFVESAASAVGIIVENSSIFGSKSEIETAFKGINTLVTTMLDHGIAVIMNKMVEIAEKTNIKGNGMELVKVVAAVIQAVAGMIGATSPTPDMMKAVKKMNATELREFLTGVTAYAGQMGGNSIAILKQAGETTSTIIKAFENIKVPKGAPEILKSIGEVINATVGLIAATKPDPDTMKAVGEIGASLGGGDDAQSIMKLVNDRLPLVQKMLMGEDGKGGLMAAIKDVIIEVMKAASGALPSLSNVNPEKIKAFGTLLGPTMSAFSGFVKVAAEVGMKAMDAATVVDEKGVKSIDSTKMETIKTTLTSVIGSVMSGIVPVMQQTGPMLDAVIKATSEIKDPKALTARVGLINKVFELLKLVSDVFAPDSAFMKVQAQGVEDEATMTSYATAPSESPIAKMARGMGEVISELFEGDAAPVKKLINAMAKIDFGPLAEKGRMKLLTDGFNNIKLLTDIVSSLGKEGAIDATALGQNMSIIGGLLSDESKVFGFTIPAGAIKRMFRLLGDEPFNQAFNFKQVSSNFKNFKDVIDNIKNAVSSEEGDADKISGTSLFKISMLISDTGDITNIFRSLKSDVFAMKGRNDIAKNFEILESGIYAIKRLVSSITEATDLDSPELTKMSRIISPGGDINYIMYSFQNDPTLNKPIPSSVLDNIKTTANALNQVRSIVNDYNTLGLELQTIFARKVDVGLMLVEIGQNVSTALTSIGTAAGTFDKASIKPIAQVVKALSNFKGGTLQVVHNIPGVEMKVDVHIDSKQIADSIINVDVSKAGTGTRITAAKRGVDPLLG